MQNIKYAGYYVEVDSWENDADYAKTVEVPVKEEHIKATVAFVSLFKSNNFPSNGIGNIYTPTDEEEATVLAIFKNFLFTYPHFLESADFFTDEDLADDAILLDILMDTAYMFGLSGGQTYTRVLESVKVNYYPHDVISYDVTANYKD